MPRRQAGRHEAFHELGKNPVEYSDMANFLPIR